MCNRPVRKICTPFFVCERFGSVRLIVFREADYRGDCKAENEFNSVVFILMIVLYCD